MLSVNLISSKIKSKPTFLERVKRRLHDFFREKGYISYDLDLKVDGKTLKVNYFNVMSRLRNLKNKGEFISKSKFFFLKFLKIAKKYGHSFGSIEDLYYIFFNMLSQELHEKAFNLFHNESLKNERFSIEDANNVVMASCFDKLNKFLLLYEQVPESRFVFDYFFKSVLKEYKVYGSNYEYIIPYLRAELFERYDDFVFAFEKYGKDYDYSLLIQFYEEYINRFNFSNISKIRKILREELDLNLSLILRNGNFNRVFNLLESDQGFQKLRTFIRNIKDKKNNVPEKTIKYESLMDIFNSPLHYRGGFYTRKMLIYRFEIWKKLYDLGIPVEEIVSYSSKDSSTGNRVEVKSKGEGLDLHFIAHRLTKDQRISVARQMISIIKKVWTAGYYHGHPHAANWIVKFDRGKPIVKLIDFDLINTISDEGYRIDLEYLSKAFDYINCSDMIKYLDKMSFSSKR